MVDCKASKTTPLFGPFIQGCCRGEIGSLSFLPFLKAVLVVKMGHFLPLLKPVLTMKMGHCLLYHHPAQAH